MNLRYVPILLVALLFPLSVLSSPLGRKPTSLLNWEEPFPIRECNRRQGYSIVNGERIPQPAVPFPWSFSFRSTTGVVDLTCWNPEHTLKNLQELYPRAWEREWDEMRTKPTDWAPLSKEQMESLCQEIFREHLAPLNEDTDISRERKLIHESRGWWWCEKKSPTK